MRTDAVLAIDLRGEMICTAMKSEHNRRALPHQESDFVFFTLHTFSGSSLRFHAIPPLHQFPLAKKRGSSYKAFQEADFW
jgi:hypothetical protein